MSNNNDNDEIWGFAFGCFALIFAVIFKLAIFVGAIAIICCIVKWILF